MKRSIEKRKEKGEFLTHYAVNQFDKLIGSRNILENERKPKERCVHLKVSGVIRNKYDLIITRFLFVYLVIKYYYNFV